MKTDYIIHSFIHVRVIFEIYTETVGSNLRMQDPVSSFYKEKQHYFVS